MVRKKTEGDEVQRRAAARAAHEAGEAPSARGVTTGASKQPTHLAGHSGRTHEERVGTTHRGKQEWRAGDLAEREVKDPTGQGPELSCAGRGRPGYSEQHEQVFQSLTAAQERHGGEAVHLDEIARTSGLPPEETRTLLHDLTQVHRLVTEVAGADRPDLGPRYEVQPRL
ncbi:hypothetical protein [Streptomyces sp. S.PNR 29]|uniref:hypothetical protein n=1 Tax=Streptomyces sp. S.PNR 29 TaxID=2973805 RepID=UPI0025B135EA|nr:hypothetical protein [Streptomyces sp. S.PNR 29]MDN0199194.1 hypothetical protein [Streptomyces sp. S.PNR 29]